MPSQPTPTQDQKPFKSHKQTLLQKNKYDIPIPVKQEWSCKIINNLSLY